MKKPFNYSPGLLAGIKGPEQLSGLSMGQMESLAEEIRHMLIESVAKTGGHLASNLGVVELTLALHRAYGSPSAVACTSTSLPPPVMTTFMSTAAAESSS